VLGAGLETVGSVFVTQTHVKLQHWIYVLSVHLRNHFAWLKRGVLLFVVSAQTDRQGFEMVSKGHRWHFRDFVEVVVGLERFGESNLLHADAREFQHGFVEVEVVLGQRLLIVALHVDLHILIDGLQFARLYAVYDFTDLVFESITDVQLLFNGFAQAFVSALDTVEIFFDILRYFAIRKFLFYFFNSLL